MGLIFSDRHLDAFKHDLAAGADPNIGDRKGTSILERVARLQSGVCDPDPLRIGFVDALVAAAIAGAT